MRVAVLTISSSGSRGERNDTSGDAIVSWARARGFDTTQRGLVPDDAIEIVRDLLAWWDGAKRRWSSVTKTVGSPGGEPVLNSRIR